MLEGLLPAGRPSAREQQSRQRLPYARHLSDHIVALDSGGMMCAYALAGAEFETADASSIQRLHEGLAAAWRNLASEDLAVWLHAARLRIDPPKEGSFSSTYAKTLDVAWCDHLATEPLYRNRLYLSLVLKGDGLDPLWRRSPDLAGRASAQAARLETISRDLMSLLAPWSPSRLGVQKRDGVWFSQPMEMLALILVGRERACPLTRGHLGEALSGSRLIFGPETLEVRHPDASLFAGILGLKAYPATTRPGLWDSLLAAPCALVISQSFAFLSRASGEALMGRKQNQMLSA
ncbi:MAG: transporter, partial [Caulobacter sp.]